MLKNKEAKEVLSKILENTTDLCIVGYYPNKGKGFTAFDNTTKDCWIELFSTEQDAIAWCRRPIRIMDCAAIVREYESKHTAFHCEIAIGQNDYTILKGVRPITFILFADNIFYQFIYF